MQSTPGRRALHKNIESASVPELFLTQRRKDAKENLRKRGSALRLCAFAREISSARNTLDAFYFRADPIADFTLS